MALVWVIFYGALTIGAVGLSLRKGGPIAVVGLLIFACWVLQSIVMFNAETKAQHIVSMSCDATLLLVIGVLAVLRPSWWQLVIGLALAVQIAVSIAYRQEVLPAMVFRYAVNGLYVVQLAALAWPEKVNR